MSNKIHYDHCPVCGSNNIFPIYPVKDHSVSSESFLVSECRDCTLRFTQDIPDEASIAPFYKSEDYISHTNTSRGIVNSLYQTVRKRTMRSKRNLIQRSTGLNQGSLLDIGSGVGSFVSEMSQHGWKVSGLEPDPGARSRAKDLYGVELEDMDRFYELAPGSFDAITLWHVLEHVHALNPYVQHLGRILKDTGKLFIAVPNYTSKDAEIYKEYWAAYDVPRHLYHFSPRSMQFLLEKNGLKLESCKPMWYDSFYISMLSSRYKSGKTDLIGSFWNGLVSNFNALSDARKCSSVLYVVSKK